MAAIALNQALAQRFILCMRLHFTHAEVELRVVTERKKKKKRSRIYTSGVKFRRLSKKLTM